MRAAADSKAIPVPGKWQSAEIKNKIIKYSGILGYQRALDVENNAVGACLSPPGIKPQCDGFFPHSKSFIGISCEV